MSVVSLGTLPGICRCAWKEGNKEEAGGGIKEGGRKRRGEGRQAGRQEGRRHIKDGSSENHFGFVVLLCYGLTIYLEEGKKGFIHLFICFPFMLRSLKFSSKS